jgi:hypothetical protein
MLVKSYGQAGYDQMRNNACDKDNKYINSKNYPPGQIPDVAKALSQKTVFYNIKKRILHLIQVGLKASYC